MELYPVVELTKLGMITCHQPTLFYAFAMAANLSKARSLYKFDAISSFSSLLFLLSSHFLTATSYLTWPYQLSFQLTIPVVYEPRFLVRTFTLCRSFAYTTTAIFRSILFDLSYT